METYILVPQESIEETLGLAGLTPAESRARIVTAADDFATDTLRILEGYGLHTQRQRRETVASEEPSYTSLPHVGAIIASFENQDHAQAALSSIGNYWLVPDIELSLPPEPIAGIIGNVEIDPTQVGWPKDSGVSQAHAQGVKGQGVLVGILDTGCDADHVEHVGQLRVFRCIPLSVQGFRDVRGFDPHGHGTHVCGILAGQRVGVAPEVSLWVASVIESETTKTSLRRIVAGLDWLTRIFSESTNRTRPALINMSLGFLDAKLATSELNIVRLAMRQMFQTLMHNLSVLPVVAIGNEGARTMRAPGYFPEALAVGAVSTDGTPAGFSGGGQSPIDGSTKPDIAGYGVDTPSSYERDHQGKSFYRYKSGTSMAAPYVTGIAALYASADPTLTGSALRAKILQTALTLPHSTDRVGAGLARFI